MNQGKTPFPASQFFQVLTQNKINMSYVSASLSEGRLRSFCLIAPEDLDRVKVIAQTNDRFKDRVGVTPAVGMVSLYPHQYRLKVLGLALQALGNACIPIYGMSSSISALTFVIDHARLHAAAVSLSEYMALPPNHSPFVPRISEP